jgi:hypothetical protein
VENPSPQPEPKHLSELDPTKRAIVDAAIRDSLLAIVVAQGKGVTLPIDVLEANSTTHRLVVEIDRSEGVVILRAERAELIIKG